MISKFSKRQGTIKKGILCLILIIYALLGITSCKKVYAATDLKVTKIGNNYYIIEPNGGRKKIDVADESGRLLITEKSLQDNKPTKNTTVNTKDINKQLVPTNGKLNNGNMKINPPPEETTQEKTVGFLKWLSNSGL